MSFDVNPEPQTIQQALKLALAKAREFQGATAPNPPVGAIGLDASGRILSLQAHEKAGTPHAEAKVLEDCRQRGILGLLHALIITLEPCNHSGRTGPCTEAILRAIQEEGGARGLRTVFFGTRDPNPRVAGQGAQCLRQAGLEVIDLQDPDSRQLIEPFAHWAVTRRPWVTLKTAFDAQGSMIPPPGQKTFSSPEALRFAHELRRGADAILTGSGTVLADFPEFTVRHLPDHPGKSRWLAVLDRRNRTPREWIQEREKAGFRFHRGLELSHTLDFLGSEGVLEVLVEAGPVLSQEFLNKSLWNRHVVITPQGIEIRKCLPASFKEQGR